MITLLQLLYPLSLLSNNRHNDPHGTSPAVKNRPLRKVVARKSFTNRLSRESSLNRNPRSIHPWRLKMKDRCCYRLKRVWSLHRPLRPTNVPFVDFCAFKSTCILNKVKKRISDDSNMITFDWHAQVPVIPSAYP